MKSLPSGFFALSKLNTPWVFSAFAASSAPFPNFISLFNSSKPILAPADTLAPRELIAPPF